MSKVRAIAIFFSVITTFFGGAAARDWYIGSSSTSIAISEGSSARSNLESACAPVQITSCSPSTNPEAYEFAKGEIERARASEEKKQALLDEATSRIKSLESQLAAVEVELEDTRNALSEKEEEGVSPFGVDSNKMEQEVQDERRGRELAEVELASAKEEFRLLAEKHSACSKKVSDLEASLGKPNTELVQCAENVEKHKATIVEMEGQLYACTVGSGGAETSKLEYPPASKSEIKDYLYIQELVGTSEWTGSVTQPSSARPYSIVLKVVDQQILVDYPELSCGGVWEYRSVIGSSRWLFSERLRYDTRRRCIDRGDVVLDTTNSSVLRYEWFRPGSETVDAWADLLPLPN